MTSAAKRAPATMDDFLRRAATEDLELIRGSLVERAAPSGAHGLAVVGVGFTVRLGIRRSSKGPGGCWILADADIRLGDEVFRPDLCGFRKERVPEPPAGWPVDVRPDWVCEVLSPSNESRDRVEKLQSYFRAGVPHYWIVDAIEGLLEVYRRTELAYALVLSAQRGQRVRAEPFDGFELSVDELLGADPAEG